MKLLQLQLKEKSNYSIFFLLYLHVTVKIYFYKSFFPLIHFTWEIHIIISES